MRKICSACGVSKSLGMYHIDRTKKDGLHPQCSTCHSVKKKAKRLNNEEFRLQDIERSRRWRLANPEKAKEIMRWANIKYKYNMTREDFEIMSNLQNNNCAICGEEVKLHVDHCHKTGKIRGLLCRNCNTSLGKFSK